MANSNVSGRYLRVCSFASNVNQSVEKVERDLTDYENNDLTPEMDKDNFEKLLYGICLLKEYSRVPALSLSVFAGTSYCYPSNERLSRPFSASAIYKNIIPFVIVNDWYKVFCIEYYQEESERDTAVGERYIKKDYLLVDKGQSLEEVTKFIKNSSEYQNFITLKDFSNI